MHLDTKFNKIDIKIDSVVKVNREGVEVKNTNDGAQQFLYPSNDEVVWEIELEKLINGSLLLLQVGFMSQ